MIGGHGKSGGYGKIRGLGEISGTLEERGGGGVQWRECSVITVYTPHWKENTKSGSSILYATLRLICREQGKGLHVMIV